MKITFYLQHPLMAMHDPRMQNLVAKETLKGIGAYWFILEKLALLPESRAQMEYLHSFCKAHKISFAYIKKVILGYQLFDFEEDGYFMPAELNPVRKRIKKDIEVDTNEVEVSEKEIQKTLENEQKSSENKQKMLENEAFYSDKSLKNICISLKMHTTNKENIKDIITSAAEKEKTAADDDLTVVDCGGKIPASGNDITPSGNKITAAFKLRPKCCILSLPMPHFIALNATCHTRSTVAFKAMKCGIQDDEVWLKEVQLCMSCICLVHRKHVPDRNHVPDF